MPWQLAAATKSIGFCPWYGARRIVLKATWLVTGGAARRCRRWLMAMNASVTAGDGVEEPASGRMLVMGRIPGVR